MFKWGTDSSTLMLTIILTIILTIMLTRVVNYKVISEGDDG